MTLKALIIDDEPPARSKLRRLLTQDERVEIVGEARDGNEALEAIEATDPDLLFLDIQMPRMNGFEVLEALGPECPGVIFITAYDQYAIKAFEVRALDYLLKPFDAVRLREAVDRAVELQGKSSSRFHEQIDDLLQELRYRKPVLKRILLKTRGRIVFIDTRQITRVESEEKYVRLHVGSRDYLHRETMNSLEERLDPSIFVRVHRRQIVNMDSIRELESLSHGDYQIVLKDGSKVPLGRTYRDQFLKCFAES